MNRSFPNWQELQAGYDAEDTPLVMREKDPDLEANLERIFGATSNPVSLLSQWGLSFHAITVLSKHSELIDELAEERAKACFPPGYTPSMIEIFYDDILCMRYQKGQISYPNPSPEHSPFMEVRFDNQMALFVINDEVVVNRVVAIAQLDQVLGRLKQV
ncbi:hypothetical protein ACKFKG_22120 [Phormidesmis sp. 146-35]